MASPNRQTWPSMFRSKHASQLWQSQPDMSSSPPSLVSGSTAGRTFKSPFSSGPEERNTDPKPRWNPRPEQIRILEALFNSGMANPPRDEIPRIRMKLQEYGPVGDANVFYWFQNRKSRSKNKQLRAGSGAGAASRTAPARTCAPAARQHAAAPYTTPPPKQQLQAPLVSPMMAPTSSSSSSSDRSSGSSKPVKPTTAAMDLLSPLAAAFHQQMHYQQLGQAPAVVSAPAPAPAALEELVPTDVEPIFLQYPQGHCLSAGELAALLGAQYMHVPVQQQQQPPAPAPASPAGMLLGLCNELAAGPTSAGHRSSAWTGAGLGQYWPSGAHQPGLGKNNEPFNTSVVATEVAHEDATKLGLLHYGFGLSSPAVNATTSAPTAVLPLPASSPETGAVTVASAAAAAGLSNLFATTTAATSEAVTYSHLQEAEPADVGFAGAATGVVRRGAAVVCIAGTNAVCNVPAGHLHVKTYFGEGALLARWSGGGFEPLAVDMSSGLTVEPLQHGAIYYCVLI